MRVKIIGQRDKKTNQKICDALQKANPALYATVRELIDTDISLSAFLKIWKSHKVGIIEKLSNGRLTNEDGALQFYLYIKKLREKKHLKENLKQFQLVKRMLDELHLRDDERLFLNKQYYSLKNKIEIAEEETSDEEDGVDDEAEDEAEEADNVDGVDDAEDDEAKDDADNVDDDNEEKVESAYEKKRRLQILANRKKIQELRNLFKRKHSNK
jgi:hypothetical protein